MQSCICADSTCPPSERGKKTQLLTSDVRRTKVSSHHLADMILELDTHAAGLPDPLANDLGGVDEVVQDGGVYRLQGAGPGPLLLQLIGLPGGLGKDPPLGDEDHVLPGELLLQLTDQPGELSISCR